MAGSYDLWYGYDVPGHYEPGSGVKHTERPRDVKAAADRILREDPAFQVPGAGTSEQYAVYQSHGNGGLQPSTYDIDEFLPADAVLKYFGSYLDETNVRLGTYLAQALAHLGAIVQEDTSPLGLERTIDIGMDMLRIGLGSPVGVRPVRDGTSFLDGMHKFVCYECQENGRQCKQCHGTLPHTPMQIFRRWEMQGW